jgi:hypothetical protein
MNRSPLLLLTLMLALPVIGWGNPLVQGFQVSYAVSRNGLPLGQSDRVFHPVGGDRWAFDARTIPTGLVAIFFKDVIEEHSELRLTASGVQPLTYSYDRHGGRKEQHYALTFDWDNRRLQFDHSDQQMQIQNGTQDPLSFLVEVMVRLQAGQRESAMAIAGRNKVRDYRMRPLDEAVQHTPLGNLTVVHIQAKEIGRETCPSGSCSSARMNAST